MTKTKTPQISIRRKYKHPISKVWRALTTKEALSEWLMETDNFKLETGSEFTLSTTPRGKFDGILRCEVLQIEKPNMLSYSWLSSSMASPTIVSWTLKELDGNQTLLTLTHDGFVGFDGWMTKTMLSFGWKRILRKKLEKHLTS